MMRENENILDSWKEIASYLDRTVKTCRKWEKELGLPIHRLDGTPKASVFAYKEELDSWLEKTLRANHTHDKKKTPYSFFTKNQLFSVTIALVLIFAFLVSIFLILQFSSKEHPFPTYKQLTFGGSASNPAISPDGKLIAYTMSEGPDEENVIIQEIDKSHSQTVFGAYKCKNLRWSPDGLELSFVAKSKINDINRIYNVSRLGGKVRQMEEASIFAWSPDATQFAWTKQSWKRIYFTNTSTRSQKYIKLEGDFNWISDIAWSPLGSLLLFRTLNEKGNSIWTIQTDGNNQRKAVDEDVPVLSPIWSPNGNAIYFLRSHAQYRELWKIPVEPQTGKPTKPAFQVFSGLHAGPQFSLSSNGKKLLFTKELGNSNLWLAQLQGTNPEEKATIKQLTSGQHHDSGPSISPDGKSIAFVRYDNENRNIFVIPLEGGTPQQKTFLTSYSCFAPVWSPDGRELAFKYAEWGEGEVPRVWKVNLSDGSLHQFANTKMGQYSHQLSWAPGQNILYHTPDHRNFSILNPITGEASPLVKDDSVGWMFKPVYSPDGRKIALSWNRTPTRGIWIINLENSSQLLIKKLENWEYTFPLGWSSDGQGVYIAEYHPDMYKIQMISLKDNEIKSVSNIHLKSQIGNPMLLNMSQDGKNFVFSVSEKNSEVWMVENFDPELKNTAERNE